MYYSSRIPRITAQSALRQIVEHQTFKVERLAEKVSAGNMPRNCLPHVRADLADNSSPASVFERS